MKHPVDMHGARHLLRSPAAVVLLLLVSALPAGAQIVPSASYAGQSLTAVLQAMQARGLRIVFASNIVTTDLRVQVEPRARPATTAR